MATTRKSTTAASETQPPDSAGRMLTRAEIAARFGVSYAVVVGWHARGAIEPAQRRVDGRYVYRESDVTALGYDRRIRVAGPGELAAAAVALFRGGADVGDVILRLRATPTAALRWAALAGALVISRDDRAEITEQLARVGRAERTQPISSADLRSAVTELVALERAAIAAQLGHAH